MKPKVGAAAKARNTTHKPLKGKRIYVDVPNSFSRAALRTLVQDFTSLGASIEEFFTQDVKYLVTACVPPDACRSIKAAAAYPSSASPFSCATAAADSPSPAESQRSPLPCSNDGSRTSRGRAILAKANQAGAKGNLFDLARQWQINVVHVDDAQKWIEKEKQKLAASRTNADGSTKQEETSPASRSATKQKALMPPFVKLEDSSRPYRPVYQVLESWPTLNFTASDGGCPFNNPTAAPKERGKAKKRCRVAETSLKASCDRDTFMPNPDKQSGEVSQGHLKKGSSRRGVKEPQQQDVAAAAFCEKQKQDAESRKPGYCECCKVKYFDITEHLKSEQHRKFASNAANYTALDLLIAGGPNMERFLEDVLRYHNVHAAEGLDVSQRPGDCDSGLKDAGNNLDDNSGVFADPQPVPSSSKASEARGRRCRLRPDVVKSPTSKRRLKSSAALNKSRAKRDTEAERSCDVPALATNRAASRREPVEKNNLECRHDMPRQSLSSRSAENVEARVTCAIGDRVLRDFSGHNPRPSNHVEEICYSTVEIVPRASRENFDKLSSHEGTDRCNAKPLPCHDRQLHFDRHCVCSMNTGSGQVEIACNALDNLPTVQEQRRNCTKSPRKKKCEGKKQLDPALRCKLREHWKVISGRRSAWHRSFSEGDIPLVLDNGCPDLPTDVSYENVSELDNIFDDPRYSWVFSHSKKEFGDVHEEIASIDRSVKNFGGYSDSYLDDCEVFFHHRLDVLKQQENHMLLAPSVRKRNRLSVSRRYRPYGDIVVKRALFCRRRIQSGGDSRSCLLLDRSIHTERARYELGATTLPSDVPAVPATVSDAVIDRNEGLRNSDLALCSQTIYNVRDMPEAIADNVVNACSPLRASFCSEAPAGELGNSCHRQLVPAESSGVLCGEHQKDRSSASPRLVDAVCIGPSTYGCIASVLPDPEPGSPASMPCRTRTEPLMLGTPLTQLAGTASNSTDRDVSLSHRSPRSAHTPIGLDCSSCPGPFGIPASEAVKCHSSAADADIHATLEQPDLDGTGSRAVVSSRNLEVPTSVGLRMPIAFSRTCRSSEAISPTKTASRSPDRGKLPLTIKPIDETAAAYSGAAAIGECVNTIGAISHEGDGSTDAQSAMRACCDVISPCCKSAQSDAAAHVCRPTATEQPFASTAAVGDVLTYNSAGNLDGGGSSGEPHITTGCAKVPAHNVENHCSSGNATACALEGVHASTVAKSPRHSSLSREVNAAVQQKLGRHVPFGATSCSPEGKLFRSSARVPKHFDLGTIVPCFDQRKRPPSVSLNSASKRQQRSAKNLQSHFEDPAVCGDRHDAPSTALAHVSASNRGLADNCTPLSVRSPASHRIAFSFPTDLADSVGGTSDFQLSTPAPARPRRLSSASIDPWSTDKCASGLSHGRDESQLLTPSKKQTAGLYRGCRESMGCRQEYRTKSHGASTPPTAVHDVEGSCVTVDGRSRSLEQLAARMNDVSPSIRRRAHSSPRSAALLEGVASSSDDFEPAPPCGSRMALRSVSPARDDRVAPRGLTLDDTSASPVSRLRLPSSMDVCFSRNPRGAKRYLYTKISLTSSLKSNLRTSVNSSSNNSNNAASPCQGLNVTLGSAGHSSVRPGLADIATCTDDRCVEQKRTMTNGSVSAKLKGVKCDYVGDKNDPYFPDF